MENSKALTKADAKALTKADAKFGHEVIAKTRQHRRKVKSKLGSRQPKKNSEHRKGFNTDKKTNDNKVISKTGTLMKTHEVLGTAIEAAVSASGSSSPTICARMEDQTKALLEKSLADCPKYDREKLGSELWQALHKQDRNISNLTSDELQHFVADFSITRNLNAEKVHLVLKDFVESKKRAIDGLNHLLKQQILRSLNSIDPKEFETITDLEVDTNTGNDQEVGQESQDEAGASQEGDSFKADSPIPIVRPRSPVILFADDLALDNIIDEGIKRASRQESPTPVDLFAKDEDGDTALHIAVVNNHKSVPLIVTAMHEKTLDIQNIMGHTPLHLAVIVSNRGIIQNLVLHGASVAVMDFNGNTPLHLSCQSGDYELNESLVTRGVCQSPYGLEAALATRNYEGEAPLHIAMSRAAESGDERTVHLFLGLKCDINITHRKTGKSSLYMAFENQQYDLARFLLARGADPNVASFSGICPLHLAAQAGKTSLVQDLITKDANIYAKTTDSETPKELASNNEIKQILEKAMKKERRNRQKAKSAKKT